MPRHPFLEAGQIVGTHGVRGEVRVQPWCDSPAQFAAMTRFFWDEGQTPVRVKARPHKNIAIARIDGVDTVEQAAVLRGRVLYAPREAFGLPADRHFIRALLGMTIVDADDGHPYGTLTDVSDTGANAVYHLTMGEDTATPGREVLIPAIPSVILSVDLDTDIIRLRPLKGLFDDEN